MRKSVTIILLLVVTTVSVHGEDEEEEDYYYNETCEHESFYCDLDDPSVFYRCIDDVFHTFHCPAGLHFSVGMQTCDWPHLADCSSSEGRVKDEDTNGDEESASSEGHDHANTVSRGEDNGEESEGAGEPSWINEAAAAGKSWWRPDGVNSDQWHDVNTIKKPVFLPHSPDKPKSDSESETTESDSETEPTESDSESETKKSDSESKTKKSDSESKSKKSDSESKSKKSDSESKSKKSDSESKSKKSDDTEDSPITATKQASSGSTHSSSDERQPSSSVKWNEGSCSSSCQLPSCYCAGSDIPMGLHASSVPQMVMITFDDEVSAAFYGYYQRLFRPGRYNPNGCPVRGCLYVSGSGTEYDLVYPLYAMGIEIASHTISHKFPHTWWSTATYQEYADEASGMRENLITKSDIPSESIKGFRVPFLQLGGDSMYSALYDSKFVYDTSMFTGNQWEGGDPVWPFTLDYVPKEKYCQHGPCPTKQYPGMWEIPVQRWYGLDGHSCAMPDGCSSTGDAEETLEYLKSNFRRFYGSNRAPFGIFIHARWFNTEHNLEGLDRFIDYLLTIDDVYLVTPSQVIEWMKSPTPLSKINGFAPWSCQGGAKDVWVEKGE